MDYSLYKPAGETALRNNKLYRAVGHTAATCVQYSVYVAEGVCKNTYNSLKRIPDHRTEDPEGNVQQLPQMAAGAQQFYIRNLYGNIEDTFNRPIESSPDGWIDVALRERESTGGYFSKLRPTGKTRRCLNLGSYNYLGFGGVNSYCTPLVEEAVRDLPLTTASSDAELGHTQLHKEIEARVAEYVGKPAAMVVGMGFATNSLVIPAIVSKGDLLLSDEQNHRSIAEGARMSGAKIKPFRHNDAEHLEELLQEALLGPVHYNRLLVLVEGIYSMEGELCDLPAIVQVAKRYGAYVYLDEAHSIGAVGPSGRGVCEELGVDTADVDIMMGTFTKSFGAAGGYVAGSHELVARLREHSAGCTDAVSMPPAVCVQIKHALRVMSGADGTHVGVGKIRQLRDNSEYFRDGLKALGLEVLGHHPSPIMPVMLYQPYKIGDFSRLAFERNLAVVVVGAPAVPLFYSRVRFCISAAHSRADLTMALQAVAEVADLLSLRFQKAPPAPWAPAGTLQEVFKQRLKLQASSAKRAAAKRDAAVAVRAKQPHPIPPLGHGDAPLAAGTGERGWHADASCYQRAPPGRLLSACDYLGLRGDHRLAEAAVKTVQRVGCGSCSPRGFYGTFPEHVKLEQQIGSFLGVNEAVLYSYGACTVSSVIPSMMKAGDVVLVDEAVSHGILSGLRLSKATVVWYKHCDEHSLAHKLEALEAVDGDTSWKLSLGGASKKRRRFIVSEGVFVATGRLAPLPALVRLKEQYRARLILEESHSFGVLGAHGRGLTEHFGLPATKVDCIAASLEGAGASVGGFAAGATGVVGYQRLMGAGYVFSAALPPYLATASSMALSVLEQEPERLQRLRDNTAYLRATLQNIPGVATSADALSPVLPLRLSHPSGDPQADAAALAAIAHKVRARGFGLCVVHASALTGLQRPVPLAPTLRVFASAAYTKESVVQFASVLEEEVANVIGPVGAAPAAPTMEVLLGSPPPSAAAGGSGLRRRGKEAMVEPPELTSPLQKTTLSPHVRPRGPSLDLLGANRLTHHALASARPRRRLSLTEATGSAAAAAAEVDPVSMSVPLLQVLMVMHTFARRYLIGQISTTERLTSGILSAVNAEPSKRESLAFSLFFLAVNFLASKTCYVAVGPAAVWASGGAAWVQLLVLCYCMNCCVGCVLKSALLTNTSTAAQRRRVASGGKARVHAWPSVAAINATALPFLALRLRFGSQWVWEMAPGHAEMVFACYTAAFAWMTLVCIARLRAGDSPADIQGGVVVGAIMPRLLLPFAETLMNWFGAGGFLVAGYPAMGLLTVGAAAALTVFPLPLNSAGAVFPAAVACYHRTAAVLLFMLTFLAGSLMRGSCATEPAPSALHAAARVALGAVVSGAVVEGATLVVRATAQGTLQLVAGRKPTTTTREGATGVARTLRAAAMELVVLSRSVSFGFAVAYAAPALFAAVGV